MAKRKLEYAKGRRESGSFLALPHAVLNHEKYFSLSMHARALLFDIYSQYNGKNNGDFQATYKFLFSRGWRSRDTIHKKLNELMDKGFLIKTRQGGRHQCSLYAVTWQAIDICGGKLDTSPTNVAPGDWKK